MKFDLHAQRAMKQIFHARNQTIDVVAWVWDQAIGGGRLREDDAFDRPSFEVPIQLPQAGFRRPESNFRGVSLGYVGAFDKNRCHIV